jgi:hypothetical protein
MNITKNNEYIIRTIHNHITKWKTIQLFLFLNSHLTMLDF